jgi:cytoskeletal protein RodZ
MKIEWTRVTWYSQIIALILFVGIFGIGIGIGMQIKASNTVASAETSTQQTTQKTTSPVPVNTVATYKCDSGVEMQETYSNSQVSIITSGTATSTSTTFSNCKQIAAPVGL